MNVFVLGTGRTGSLTFSKACRHITNFTSAHTSRVAALGDDRVSFPDNHIEIDGRLSWFLGRLEERFGDDAYYVHLTRDPVKTAASWARRFTVAGGMASAYRDGILSAGSLGTSVSREAAAADYVRTVRENVRQFLKDKTHAFHFEFEKADDHFRKFWEWIGAEGDLDAALAEWKVRYDGEKDRLRPVTRARNLARRLSRAVVIPK